MSYVDTIVYIFEILMKNQTIFEKWAPLVLVLTLREKDNPT